MQANIIHFALKGTRLKQNELKLNLSYGDILYDSLIFDDGTYYHTFD